MKIGFVGLGKMGSQMVQRVLNEGHEVYAYDHNQEAVDAAVKNGANGVSSYTELAQGLGEDAVVWVMIPEKFVGDALQDMAQALPAGSVVVDGGNSDYRNTIKHAEMLSESDIQLVDVGTSGGVHGLEQGFSMMVGGEPAAVKQLDPIFRALAHKDGYAHFGPSGAGHYTKMVHNGIEYGIMQAYAEGYRVIKEGPYPDVDLAKLAGVWQNGSINESFLNGLIQDMLTRDPEFEGVGGEVHESGEARWTLESAREHNVDTPVIQAAFDVRLRSQKGEINYATKFLAQLRNEFGGHNVNEGKK